MFGTRYDFLFSYYYLSAGALKRWHPGAGYIIANPGADRPAPQAGAKFYREVTADAAAGLPHGGWTVDVTEFGRRQANILDFVEQLLSATVSRDAKLSCFGLHEWAMAYRSDVHGLRHASVPLRLGAQGTDDVVESHKISCSHFDAFRFYAPEAREMNHLQPTRDTMIESNNPVSHANGPVGPNSCRQSVRRCWPIVSNCGYSRRRYASLRPDGWVDDPH